MGKKVDNLHRLVRDLESRYGKEDVDVKRLQAELNLLEASKAADNLGSPPYRHSLAKQHYRGFRATELT
jgi:hypothetical protein